MVIGTAVAAAQISAAGQARRSMRRSGLAWRETVARHGRHVLHPPQPA